MTESIYRGRRAVTIENPELRVTVLVEGGHVAEILDKRSGVNPLWTPPWPSIEPSAYDPVRHPEYGDGVDARLLAGIMGHNLCLDFFGPPSDEEAAAGLTPHGEASVAPYVIDAAGAALTMRASLRLAGLQFERRIELHGGAVRFHETVDNQSACDRPVGWTQHVTLGPPFLQKGVTTFGASATRAMVFERDFGGAGLLEPGALFDWPMAPALDGGRVDLRTMTDRQASSAFSTHLMDPGRAYAWFVAFSPESELAFGYVWRRADFPWLGLWEENHGRTHAPWLARALTRGMEFGASPFPETRRRMIERGRLFEVPTFRWLPAGSRTSVEYWAVARRATAVPDALDWPG